MFSDKFNYYTCIKYLVPWCNAIKQICKTHAILFNLYTCLSYVKHNGTFMFANDYTFLRNGDLNKVRYLHQLQT